MLNKIAEKGCCNHKCLPITLCRTETFFEVGLIPSQALSCAGSEGIISGCFI